MPVDAYEISFSYKYILANWEKIGALLPSQSVYQQKNLKTI